MLQESANTTQPISQGPQGLGAYWSGQRSKSRELGAASASTLVQRRCCVCGFCLWAWLLAMFTAAWRAFLNIQEGGGLPRSVHRACCHPTWLYPYDFCCPICTADWTVIWPSAFPYPVQSLCPGATLTGWESKIMNSLKKCTRGPKVHH